MKYMIKLGQACSLCQEHEIIDPGFVPEKDEVILKCGADGPYSPYAPQGCPLVRILNLFRMNGLEDPREYVL